MSTLAENKRARFDYEILEKFEAGLVLFGHEVKSVREGKMGLSGAHVIVRGNAAWLIGGHIPKYSKAGPLEGYDPERSRRLLLHQRELVRIQSKLDQKGLTIIPLSVYTQGSNIKISVGIVRGKKQYEKRESIRQRDVDRELRRAMK